MLKTVVVRGIGDVGSAVAHALSKGGYRVWISDRPMPAAPRRGMAFADAAFDGTAELEGVTAACAYDVGSLKQALAGGRSVPVYLGDPSAALAEVPTDVLVDARMRKHAVPECQIGLAPLTIGLGPNFEAGVGTDVVVETQWGDELGKVIWRGRTKELTGEPRNYGGYARERFVYAPATGLFRTDRRIGDVVEGGQTVAAIGEMNLTVPVAGMLRGLVHDCVPVTEGAKVIEVDPRCDARYVFGIGERPRRIARGVLEAIEARQLNRRGG